MSEYNAAQEAKRKKKAYESSRHFDRIVNTFETENRYTKSNIEAAKILLNGVQDSLNKLYSVGIIYPKYRDLVAVTMFCEYMDAGRREKLEGVGGMYDLYEQEIATKEITNNLEDINSNLRKISSQLDHVSYQLSGIIRNQHMLYKSVEKGNEISDTILSELRKNTKAIDDAISSSERIAKAQEVIAKNSKVLSDQNEVLLRIARRNWDY